MIMLLKQVLITVLVVLAVEVVLASGVLSYLCRNVSERLLIWFRAVAIDRFFPDGLLSIGALLVIRDYMKDRIKAAVTYVREKTSL